MPRDHRRHESSQHRHHHHKVTRPAVHVCNNATTSDTGHYYLARWPFIMSSVTRHIVTAVSRSGRMETRSTSPTTTRRSITTTAGAGAASGAGARRPRAGRGRARGGAPGTGTRDTPTATTPGMATGRRWSRELSWRSCAAKPLMEAVLPIMLTSRSWLQTTIITVQHTALQAQHLDTETNFPNHDALSRIIQI